MPEAQQQKQRHERKPRRGEPLVHHMNRDDLYRALAKAGVKVQRQKSAKRRDKKNGGRKTPHSSREGGKKMPNGTEQQAQQAQPDAGSAAYAGRTVKQVLKEEGIKTGIQTVAGMALITFGVWLNKRLG